MNMKKFSFLLFLLAFSLVHADILLGDISPTSAYQYLTTNYSVNVSSTNPLINASWYLNNSLIKAEALNNITSGTLTLSLAINNTGTYNLSVVVYDNSSTSNQTSQNITILQYLLPSVSSVTPTNTSNGTPTYFSVLATQGSFPLANITWGFQNSYLTNIVFNGTNYQMWNFSTPGWYQVSVQVCDVNLFCSNSLTSVYVSSNTPTSYWQVVSANLYLNLSPPNVQRAILTFAPYNDSYSLATVFIDWGDGTPVEKYTYTSPISSDTYYHTYPAQGIYNMSVTTCDSIGNCYSQFIATVDYRYHPINAFTQALYNSQETAKTSDILKATQEYFTSNFGAILGTIFFFIFFITLMIILIGTVYILVVYFLVKHLGGKK